MCCMVSCLIIRSRWYTDVLNDFCASVFEFSRKYVRMYVFVCLFVVVYCICSCSVLYCTQRGQAFIFKHGQVAKRDYVRELWIILIDHSTVRCGTLHYGAVRCGMMHTQDKSSQLCTVLCRTCSCLCLYEATCVFVFIFSVWGQLSWGGVEGK